jgi:ribosomal protein S12 methylthiotransferase
MTAAASAPASAPLSVGFVSLGCAKNLVDSQRMAGALLADGLALAPSADAADVVVVNTCAFVEAAREESLAEIRRACRLKARGRCRAVIVAGCLPQRYRDRVRQALPDVDGFVGLDELDRLGEVARRVAGGERGVVAVTPGPSRRLDEAPGQTPIFTGGAYAYLKIAEGCDHRCTFCAIPAIRGAQRSRPLEAIVREAGQRLDSGVRELTLVAQDTTAYGLDRYGRSRLPDLLRALSRFGGRYWVRWLYGYPTRIGDALLAAMAECAPVCRYLDVPIQHSHPDVLRRMGRGDTVRAVAGLAARVRAAMPDATLRTTCLVGFPGETAARFDRLLGFARETGFDHLGAFAYSPEEGTPAVRMPSRPSAATAQARRARLMAVQRRVVAARLAARVGQEDEVLLERRAAGPDNPWLARSRRLAPEMDGAIVVRRAGPRAAVGDFARVRYTAARDYDLEAVRLPDAAGREGV